MNTTLVTRAVSLVIVCLLAALPVAAQDVAIPKIAADGSLSIEQIESAMQSVTAREGISDEVRGDVVEQLRDAPVLARRVARAGKECLGTVEA